MALDYDGRTSTEVGTSIALCIPTSRRPAELDVVLTSIAALDLGDRIEIRNQDVTTLAERDRYDCGWLPAPFLPEAVLVGAIPRVIDAVKPGGLVAIGVQKTPEDPLAAATQRLRNISDTGATQTVDSIRAMCHDAGLEASVLNPDATIPIAFVGGRV